MVQQKIIYLNPTRSSSTHNSTIKIKDIATVYCIDPEIQKNVEEISMFHFHKELCKRQVITVLKMIEEIQKIYPNIPVENIGDPEIIIYHKPEVTHPKKDRLVTVLKIIFVCVFSFFGAGFTIMNYNNDVGVRDIFTYIYTLVVGYEPKGNTVIELGYSIGLTIGLFYFFNHVANKRFSDDPTPLEVEMRLYERDVNDTAAISSSRNKKTLDVK